MLVIKSVVSCLELTHTLPDIVRTALKILNNIIYWHLIDCLNENNLINDIGRCY